MNAELIKVICIKDFQVSEVCLPAYERLHVYYLGKLLEDGWSCNADGAIAQGRVWQVIYDKDRYLNRTALAGGGYWWVYEDDVSRCFRKMPE